MQEKITGYPDLIKVNHSFVINTNDDQYHAALLRRKTHRRLDTLEERVLNIENLLQQILELLPQKDSY